MARIVVLAGGTGGAKLARGMLDVAGDELTVIANTGDDIEMYGAHVSPDPDLVTFWLADVIDERGWGLRGDTFAVMEGLRALGDDVWFNLGDRDLAWCLRRARRLTEGATPTEALAEGAAALGVRARVLPMTDASVRTAVLSGGEWRAFQEFMVRERAAAPVEGVEFRGAPAARSTGAALEALAAADAIVIGPSNPVASIAPILAVGGVREALLAARAPVVAVSPFVGGHVVKGPTEPFLRWAGVAPDAGGVAAYYGDLLAGLVCDEEDVEAAVPALVTATLMDTPEARARLASETLHF
ncbi:MAG TPA: 2-phospho-L-lactate transferase, partial [Solirubrobacteraceae bacterium]